MTTINEVRPFGQEKPVFWLSEQNFMNKPMLLTSFSIDNVQLNESLTIQMVSMLLEDENKTQTVVATTSEVIADKVRKLGHENLPASIEIVQKHSRKTGRSYYTIVDSQ